MIDIKKFLADTITTGDKLRFLLSLSHEKWPIQKIYVAFNKLKDAFPDEFSEITFYKIAGTIHSRELERYLSDFDTYGIITIDNSSFSHYSINPGVNEMTNNEFERLSNTRLEKYKKMAHFLDNCIKETSISGE